MKNNINVTTDNNKMINSSNNNSSSFAIYPENYKLEKIKSNFDFKSK